MKKILQNNEKTKKYLNSIPKMYLIACWAGFGIREFPFAGKCDENGIPYVYDYDDCNGTCDCYFLRKITDTTTGTIYAWTIDKTKATGLANYANTANGEEWRNR